MLKLSEAIRVGAKKRPQVKYLCFDYIAGGGLGSCAVGAAIEGYTGRTERDTCTIPTQLARINPELKEFVRVVQPCPACGEFHKLAYQIGHLNDVHDWTREHIAGWIETLEGESN